MYLKLLFVPHPLSSDYSFRQIPMVGFDNSIALGSLILHGALGVYALLRVRQRDPIAYGILFYLIGMSLVGNVLFLTHSTMADRFLFTPSLGFCAALVFAMTRLLPLSKPFALAVGCIVVAFALKTWTRNPDWRNDTAIFAADARHSPNSARVHFLNGNHTLQELKQGKVAAGTERQQYIHALSEFHRAIELYPAYAEPHMGIGEAYTYGGDVPAAIDWYRQMVARNPRFAVGFYALGLVYHSKGDADSARVYLNKAYALDPTLKK
jgi:tetratricopeptide (TPR) repeat protein